MIANIQERPLSGIKVVDAVTGPLTDIGRTLANLGAQVCRWQKGFDSVSLQSAHIVIADSVAGIDFADLRSRRPEVVTMAVSAFGTGNPLSGWHATDPVLHALSAELSRSGTRGHAPLLPPGELASKCAAPQAAFALLGAVYRSLTSGKGAHFDFSVLDGAVQALDPGFGVNGSATLGRSLGLLIRGRPKPGVQYPIFQCRDGFVRICLLSKRQWQGMFRWLGEPLQFSSPEFEKADHRFASQELRASIAAFMFPRTRRDLEREGQANGVPISALLSFGEFATSDHVSARNAVIRHADGSLQPNGILTIDGMRMGPDAETVDVSLPEIATVEAPELPFAGLKVIDLGVIVVGAEQARLLGDLGADVIKVESTAFPDGNRQSYLKHGMSVSFAAGHRNKRSLGLDLRSEQGRELFLRLVRQADIVCANFKPGTMEKLGLGEEVLRGANPKIILSESSAFGDTGPWSGRMGYGPLVRAATGVTQQWRYPDDTESFSDSITIYPDHVVGRICATGVAALLIRRLRTGRGGTSRVAQAEVVLDHFDFMLSAGPQDHAAAPDWPWGVFPASGDDEWCVITIRSDAEWLALCDLTGFADGECLATPADRLAARAQISHHLVTWLAARDRHAAAQAMQAAGIPAAPMLRLAELPDHPYYRSRAFFRQESHPWLREIVHGESYVVATADLPPPPSRPAPLTGEQTEAVVADWLGIPPEEIAALCAAQVLEPLQDSIRRHAEEYMGSAAAEQDMQKGRKQ